MYSRPLVALVPALVFALAGGTAAVAQNDAGLVRDPTAPFVAAGPGDTGAAQRQQALRLTAVLVSSQRRIAVINGEFFRIGDEVSGHLITAIEPGKVYLKSDQRELVMQVNASTVAPVDGVSSDE